MTTKRNPKTRITLRKTEAGYQVSSRPTRFRKYDRAFEAAWRDCLRRGVDLYAITPTGEAVLALTADSIREYRAQ